MWVGKVLLAFCCVATLSVRASCWVLVVDFESDLAQYTYVCEQLYNIQTPKLKMHS